MTPTVTSQLSMRNFFNACGGDLDLRLSPHPITRPCTRVTTSTLPGTCGQGLIIVTED